MLATEDFGYSQKTCDLCVGDKKKINFHNIHISQLLNSFSHF